MKTEELEESIAFIKKLDIIEKAVLQLPIKVVDLCEMAGIRGNNAYYTAIKKRHKRFLTDTENLVINFIWDYINK